MKLNHLYTTVIQRQNTEYCDYKSMNRFINFDVELIKQIIIRFSCLLVSHMIINALFLSFQADFASQFIYTYKTVLIYINDSVSCGPCKLMVNKI